MKSSTILASLLSLAAASPIATVSKTPQSCGSRGQKPCPAGQFCDMSGVNPMIQDMPGVCAQDGVMSILPISIATRTTTAVSASATPISCGSRGQKPCPAGQFCDMSGVNPMIQDMPGVCAQDGVMSILPIAVATTAASATPTRTATVGARAETCGGFLGTECATGFECVLDAECVEGFGSDCQGVCQAATIAARAESCGGFLGVECATGSECVLDAECVEGFGSDCQGVCKAATIAARAESCGGFLGEECAKGLECVLDAECVEGFGSDCQGVCQAA